MHALNGWLKAVRADGFILARTRVAGPWGYAVELGDDVVFNFVAEGRAFVRRPGAETMELQAGELVMFPRGGAHEVAHSARGKAMPLETFMAKRNGVVDHDPNAVTLICGRFNLDRHLALPALRALPQAVSLRVGMAAGVRLLHARLGRHHFSGRKRLVFGCALAAHSAGSRAHTRGTRTCVDTRGTRPRSWFVARCVRSHF